ncbi:uncharacterized protein LOC117651113 [Thrips palmi]|uniref:Uncharacterized protein LOC117651113 n=1 Tax=Thrips palmi TaxID=161013 RepID=A0A6P9A1P2_THRPL|nr:uncharacterized protein LOC117651113 [Thrips palmi]
MHFFILSNVLISGTVLLFQVGCFASIDEKLLAVHFEYPGPAISERDLPICTSYAVCSVLHKRFWMSPIVQRLCRCLRVECPYEWSDYPENKTMHLDNRSQLKFCDDVSELSECGQNKLALTVAITTTELESTPVSPTPTVEEERKLSVNVSCFCPSAFAWEEQPQKQVIQNPENGTIIVTQYMCKPMQKCSSSEFCGNIRADYFSTYYRCSCPIGHMCLNKNRTMIKGNELLYEGQVYQAFCYPQ